jgi:hypothetical protein
MKRAAQIELIWTLAGIRAEWHGGRQNKPRDGEHTIAWILSKVRSYSLGASNHDSGVPVIAIEVILATADIEAVILADIPDENEDGRVIP